MLFPRAIEGGRSLSRQVVGRVLSLAVFALAYLGTAYVGFAVPGLAKVSPWWLPSALGMWLLVRRGARYLPFVVICELAVAVLLAHARFDLLTAGAAVVNKGVYALPALWLRRSYGPCPRLDELRSMTAVLASGVGAAGLAALTGVPFMIAQGTAPAGSFWSSALVWWAGDVVGTVCLLPALFAAGAARATHRFRLPRRIGAESLLQGAAVLAVPVAGAALTADPGQLVYLTFIPVVWVTLRRGLLGGLLAALSADVSITLIFATRSASGINVGHLQLFITAVTVTAAYLGCVVNQNRALTRSLEDRVAARTAELAAANASLAHAAFHDPLTGLANRALFIDRVNHALALHGRDLRPLAVLFCDLDDFKLVNDTLGHPVGDQLLIRVAERLIGCLRDADTIARMGGDEFAVLLERDSDPVTVAARVLGAIHQPFALAGQTIRIGVSVGIAPVSPDDATPTCPQLMSRADVAMYTAKQAGKNQIAMWNTALHARATDQLLLSQALADAVAEGDIGVAYQPIVDAASGRPVAVEALARWTHDGRQVPPSAFIPAAEAAGLLGILSGQVLGTATGDLARLAAHHSNPDLMLTVNLATEQLRDPAFPAQVLALLQHHDIAPKRLILEVTEQRLLLGTDHSAIDGLRNLAAHGIQIALDDFGCGYSGLAHLSKLPLDIVKIDRMFINFDETSGRDTDLLHGVIDIAHRLGLVAVVEGVETPEQLEVARRAGCDSVQGYLTGRPARLAAPALAV
jgi:diguanylate cyclase (GGDEF)-like protein